MKLLEHNLLKCVLMFILIIAISGCTYTKNFPPKLNGKGDTVIAKIKGANNFEDIALQEKTTSGSQGNTTIITIKLFNGKNLPSEKDTVGLKKLGKDIAGQLKPALADAATISGYVVLFCTRVVDGNSTNTNFTGYEYKSSEL
jgi:hypothetical protein